MKNIEEIVCGKLIEYRFWRFPGLGGNENLMKTQYWILVERYNKILKMIYHDIKGPSLNFDEFSKFEKEMIKAICIKI